MYKTIRVGTRSSRLARWQAEEVSRALLGKGFGCAITNITSDGDINLVTPLYETGIQGIFTRALDCALLENKIDIAVHSYKDVPTSLAEGLKVAAVLKRGNPFDVLVHKHKRMLDELDAASPLTIATSSIRRKAQWLYKYKRSGIVNIRGNVQTRLDKLQSSSWHGAVFAAAGLERLGITEDKNQFHLKLDWMLPAPAQGAIVVVCRQQDEDIVSACADLNDEDTQLCTSAERDFLRLLQGGCSAPVGAFAYIEENKIHFKGNITAPDGSKSVSVSLKGEKSDYSTVASQAVDKIIIHHSVQELFT